MPPATRRPPWAALVALAVLGLAAWGWWSYKGNERRIDDLMDTAYVYSGFPGEPDLHHLHYKRRRNLGDWCPDPQKDWIGVKAASRDDPTLGPQGAEPAASRFEAEGWEVSRRLIIADGGPTERSVDAKRGDDRISIWYFEGAISISASSGPCNPAFEASVPPEGDSIEVDRFDD